MKLKYLSFFNVGLLFSIVPSLASCTEDPYIDIFAVTSCSPELLEFVTPTVEIISNGEKYTYTLSSADFKESTVGNSVNNTITINGVTSGGSSVVTNNIAKCEKRFDNTISVNGDIKVTYIRNPDIEPTKDTYIFFHGIGYDYTIDDGDNHKYAVNGNYTKPEGEEVMKVDVDNYIQELVSKQDNITFKVPERK